MYGFRTIGEMADDQEERREIEAYLDQYHLQAFIGDAVNDVVKERPKDPLVRLADALRSCSEASRQIQKVHGRQILNGEAIPALEVEIRTGQVSPTTRFVDKEVAGFLVNPRCGLGNDAGPIPTIV